MKVKNYIRIRKDTVDKIRELDAVECVEMSPGGNIVVLLKQEFTKGKREAFKDEYLVQWENGEWQRFGENAFLLLFKNPDKEAGKRWRE